MKFNHKVILVFIGLILVFIFVWIVFKATIAMIAMSILGFAISGVVWVIQYSKARYNNKETPGKWFFIWWGVAFTLGILTIQLIIGFLMAYMWILISLFVIAVIIVALLPRKKKQ